MVESIHPIRPAGISILRGFFHIQSLTLFHFRLKPNSTRHFCHDLELRGGDLISSPVDSIASLVSPKKSYGPNSVGKNFFFGHAFFHF